MDEKPTKAIDEKNDLYPGLNVKYAVYIIIAVILLVGVFFIADFKKDMPTSFAVYDPGKADYYLGHLDELKSLFNSNADKLPSTLRWTFGDERVNLTFAKMDGSEVNLAVETENGLIKNINTGEMKEPTMQAEVKEDTLKRISESESQVDELEKAIDSGEIEYRSETVKSSVKMGAVKTLINIFSWFS